MNNSMRKPTRRRLLKLLALCLCPFLAVACSAATPATDTAPEFTGISHWINSQPLTMQSLRGKVVLIDFWAYSCINCLRTLPHVTGWYEKYKDDGFVVVGVHSPEFDFGKSKANVLRAVKKYNIQYPVAMDSDMATWRAWDNHYWPSEYLVNRQGKVIEHHIGEGHYQQTEAAIRKALGLGPMDQSVADKNFAGIGSPEMYFGRTRVRNLANKPLVTRFSRDYELPKSVAMNRFALGGRWKLTNHYAQLTGDQGEIRLRFQAGNVYMVAAAADKPVTLHIQVDGKPQPDVTVDASRLYSLFESDHPARHSISIKVDGQGFRAFTFTFG